MSRFKNLGILLACLVAYSFLGKANRKIQNPKKIVVLRWTPYMGDVVYTTPLFRAVKKRYPESRVYVVGSGRVGEVVRHNPDVDEFIEYKGHFWEMVRRIRKEQFDFGCVAKPGTSEGFALLYLGGVKAISLFDVSNEPMVKSATYPFMLKLGIPIPFYNHQYIPSQFLKLLEPIGITDPDPHFKLYFSREANEKILNTFKEHGVSVGKDFIVGIAPGGSTEERWWPSERFAHMARLLIDEYDAAIILLGAGKDKKAIDVVVHGLGSAPVIDFCGQNLDEFKATVSRCSLAIGNDSGLMVTADAFDVPQMIFVGPTDPREYHTSPTPTYRILQAKTRNVQDISLEEAVKELTSLVQNIPQAKRPASRPNSK